MTPTVFKPGTDPMTSKSALMPKPATPWQKAAARRVVAKNALDDADEAGLLAMLGLDS
jgi:hypothetical protein